MSPRRGLLLLAGLVIPAGVAAQHDLARVDSSDNIAAFRARLQHADDALLSRLADSLNGVDHTPASAIRTGLVLLGRGELHEAEQELNWAVQRDWDNPDIWFALGEVRKRLAREGGFAKAAPLMGDGAGYIGGASAAWFRVLELDPSRQDAVVALASLVGRKGFTNDPVTLLPILQLAAARSRDSTSYRLLMETEAELEDYPAAGATWHEYAAAGGREPLSGLVPDDRPDSSRLAISHDLPRPTLDIFRLQARLYFQIAEYDSALAAVERYACAGGDSAIVLFERSRLSFALGRALEGTREYYDAVRVADDSVSRAALREDLALTADSTELTAWDVDTIQDRAAWVRHFWQQRDVEDGRPLGSRLAEHRRREVYALAHYRLPPEVYSRPFEWTLSAAAVGGGLREGLNDPQAGPDRLTNRIHRISRTFRGPFDDRGLVYMRHGEPDRRVTGSGVNQWYAEDWKYLETDGPRVLHFAGPPSVPPRLYLVTAPATGDAACQLDAWYCARAAAQLTWKDDLDFQKDIRKSQKVRKAGEHVLRSDDNELVYPTPMDGIVQIYGVAGGLLGVFAVPSHQLVDTAGRAVPLNYRLSAAPGSGTAAQVDDVGRLEAGRELPEGSWLQGLVVLRAPPGQYQASLALSDTSDSRGAVFRLPAVQVPAFGTGRRVMSDLILGEEESTLVWDHLGTPIGINATNAYRQGASAELYYQVDGQVPGRRYRTRIEVRKGDHRPDASLRFTETATSPRAWYKRSMGLARVRPGSYRLILTVTDTETGEELVREQRLNVR